MLAGLAGLSMCSMLVLCLAVALGVLTPRPKSGLVFFASMLAFVVSVIMLAVYRPASEQPPEQE